MNELQNSTTTDVMPGRKPVLELLLSSPQQVDSLVVQQGKSGPDIGKMVDACKAHNIRFSFAPKSALDRMFSGNHQGVIARMTPAPMMEPQELFEQGLDAPLPLILCLDQVQDPGNAGTLIRTLHALGGAGILLAKHNAVHLGAAAAKASAGALAKMPAARGTNLPQTLDLAKRIGYAVYGTGMGEDAENPYQTDLTTPAVLVLGNEEKGVRPSVAKRCDAILAIPQSRQFDSINVAQAGAILMGEFVARRFR